MDRTKRFAGTDADVWRAGKGIRHQLSPQRDHLGTLGEGIHTRRLNEIPFGGRIRFAAGTTVLVNRDVVTQLLELPQHVRAIQQHIECHILRHTSQTRSLVGLQIAITVRLRLVLHPFLIVALGIRDIPVSVGSIKTITVFEPSHRRLAIRIRNHITRPALHAVADQLLLTGAPMLQNHIGSIGHRLDMVVVITDEVRHSIIGVSAKPMTEV